MSDERSLFALSCLNDAPAPVLSGVAATGRLDGVLFDMTLRQTYRNTGERNLEVVYTFPLPHQAVLLGFASELNGQRMAGTMTAKPQAERQYEEALAEGHAPVMLERVQDGLHTANIGNLKPGDELVIELRYAQTLAFEQGRLRLSLPTTIAPRYGDAARAGLQPQQVPQASLLAQYPLSLSVTVARALSGASIECPTHRFDRVTNEGGVLLTLAQGAWLDRDMVILVKPREERPSLLIQAKDAVSNGLVRMAVMQPPLAPERGPIALKLLVDCSGSMAGESIGSARAALRGVVGGLQVGDQVSVSRFGSSIEHVLAPTTFDLDKRRVLLLAIDKIDADMGGTEMERALRGVLGLKLRHGTERADVLMITDGEVWQVQELIDAARASAHRVFIIGVGSSPAESVLRSLAEATGGACEFATPGEALEAAAQRMLQRVRQSARTDLQIDWGTEPEWQGTLPGTVFGGDTLVAFAGFAAGAKTAPARLLATHAQGEQVELACTEADAPCPGDSLPRIAAAHRIANADDEAALSLALRYQLLTAQTNCILVHERADADKAVEATNMHRVASMLAAGWGGVSFGMEMAAPCYGSLAFEPPNFMRSMSLGPIAGLVGDDLSFMDEPAGRPQAQGPASLQDFAAAVIEHLSHGGRVDGLPSHCQPLQMHADLRRCLDEVKALGVSDGEALVLLAKWVCDSSDSIGDVAAIATLRPCVDDLDPSLVSRSLALFAQNLQTVLIDGWQSPRGKRIARSLERSGG